MCIHGDKYVNGESGDGPAYRTGGLQMDLCADGLACGWTCVRMNLCADGLDADGLDADGPPMDLRADGFACGRTCVRMDLMRMDSMRMGLPANLHVWVNARGGSGSCAKLNQSHDKITIFGDE